MSMTKMTVIIGYVLIVGIMALGLVTIYNNLVDYSNKKTYSHDISELLIVSNTLSLLFEIESEQNLLTPYSARRYFQKYDSIVPVINDNLAELKIVATDTTRVLKLDSIEMLVGKKKENLKVMAALLDSVRQAPRIMQKTEISQVPRKLNQDIFEYLKSKDLGVSRENKSDTSVVMGERKGFFSRIRDAITGQVDSTIVIESKSRVTDREFELMVDTIINKVIYSEQLDLQSQSRFYQALLVRQEIVTNINHMITARINDLLKEIEQEEMMKSFQLLADREEALASSQDTMHLSTLLAIAIAILFGLLFLVSINRSQRYRRQLEVSNTRVTDLLASRERMMLTISHDIKAPMSSILGYLELYKELLEKGDGKADGIGSENPAIIEYVVNMQHSGQHVMQLVSSLLDYHKLEAGVWQMQPSNINLYKLVEDTTLSFKPIAIQKKLAYRVDNKLPAETIYYVDAYMIRQVMGNLISNAIKYTSEGEVAIEVSEVVKEKGKERRKERRKERVKERVKEKGKCYHFLFKVSDTGLGIDKEEQSLIFQDFKQLDHDGKSVERVEGSGLGLVITKGFVEQMNGSISVESEKGAGSLFIVDLPMEPAREESATASDTESRELEALKALEGINVLVVDDDPVQLNMVAKMLNKANVRVVTENRPERVTSILGDQRFDLLFLDLQMPGMNGFMLVKEIRRLEGNSHRDVPVIALSARNDVSPKSLLDAGFTGYLTKPFTFAQICDTMLKNVDRQDVSETDLIESTSKAEGYDIKDSDSKGTDLKSKGEKSSDAEVIGVEALIDYVKEDSEASLTILKSFVEETTHQVTLLKSAFNENNVKVAGEIAHRVLPLIQMMGDEILTGRLKRLEKREALPKDEEQPLLDSLEAKIGEAKRMVRRIEGNG